MGTIGLVIWFYNGPLGGQGRWKVELERFGRTTCWWHVYERCNSNSSSRSKVRVSRKWKRTTAWSRYVSRSSDEHSTTKEDRERVTENWLCSFIYPFFLGNPLPKNGQKWFVLGIICIQIQDWWIFASASADYVPPELVRWWWRAPKCELPLHDSFTVLADWSRWITWTVQTPSGTAPLDCN